jgi:hypothetical protein
MGGRIPIPLSPILAGGDPVAIGIHHHRPDGHFTSMSCRLSFHQRQIHPVLVGWMIFGREMVW